MTLRHEEEEYADNLSSSAPGKIKVVCHGCGARYQVRDSKVRGHRFRATCKRCGGIIVARCDNAFTVLPDQGARAAPRVARPGALRLGGEDLQQQEDEPVWYVAIAGKPHGPLTPIQVRRSFQAKRISGKTYLWRAGDPEWRRLVDMPEFSDLFGEAPTGFYDAPSESALEGTGETHAGGPMGLRRRREVADEDDGQRDHFGAAGTVDPDRHRVIAPQPSDQLDDYADESVGGQTAVRYPEPGYGDLGMEGSDAEATYLRERGAEPRFPEQIPEQQPLWDLPPAVPRRRAVLPAPTGSPRRFDPLPPGSPPATEPEPAVDQTRPLREDERLEVRAGPPPALPFPKPGIVPPPPAAPPSFGVPPSVAPRPASSFLPDLPLPPPPPKPFEDVLKPVGPQPMLPPLRPEEVEEEGFWTAGKIAAAAAIAGGLAVALTVVLVVAVMRPKTRIVDNTTAKVAVKRETPPPAEPRISVVAPKEEPAKEEPKAAKEEPKAAAKEEPKAAAKEEPKAAAKEEPKAAKEEPKAAAKPEPKAVAVAKPAPAEEPDEMPPTKRAPAVVTRTKLKKKAGAAPVAKPAKKSEKVDVDDLLAGAAAASKKEPRAAKKTAPADSAADDVLAAGSQRKPAAAALPVKPSAEQIKAAIRPVMGRVQACYDKFRQAGLVKLRITLRPDGSHSAGVVSSTAGAETASCVMGAVRSARFPRFSGPEYSFAYPFELK